MSLKDQIAADSSAVFLDAVDGFAYLITRRIKGDVGNTETVTAIVDWDKEIGTNEKDGDGVNQQNKHGRRNRRSVSLDMSLSVEINAGSTPDEFVLDDGNGDTVVVKVERVHDRDIEGAMQTVLCVVVEGISSRQSRPIP